MTKLSQHIYAELAAIVGERNLSDDDSFLASHDWFGFGSDPSTRSLEGRPPAVVVLPGSTEEVAGIVKACNRHGIKFKAHSTGYGNFAGTGTAGSVSIDLRRMNRLEIDAKNRMAIIEPCVTAGQLMSEALKHHLMCHIIGAGPLHSPLASATSMAGVGVPGNHTGNNARNLLSLEWVTPEGEIVRIGSSGSDDGWFTGEGPGPGFRGMIRGVMGTFGGLGVFTRIGYKLYPWAGPDKLEWTGSHPERGVRLPEHFSFHQLSWQSWEDMTEGTYQLQQARIPTFITRTPPSGIGMMLTPTNREYYEEYSTERLPAVARGTNGASWSVILMAWSAAELAWKQEVLKSALERTRGKELALEQMHRELLSANLLTSLYVARFMRMGSVHTVSMGILDSVGLMPKLMKVSDELLGDKLSPGGTLLQAETEQNWMWLSEGRHLWAENNPVGTRFDPRSSASAVEFILQSFYKGEKDPVGITYFLYGPTADLFGPALQGVNAHMRKVKNLFDPKNLSDSKNFITPEPSPAAKVWPLMKRIVFRRWFAPVLRRALAKQFK